MIQYTTCEKSGLKVAESVAKCDKCGNGLAWGPGKCRGTPKGDLLRKLLKNEGWSIKKKHLCPICAAQNIKKKHDLRQELSWNCDGLDWRTATRDQITDNIYKGVSHDPPLRRTSAQIECKIQEEK
ncbi:MAG TPA: hypothetical protein VJ327_11035 [Patescibacteria group bacterium]|nr:hypothetical protein [Patescibacteria group bacterium]